MDEDEDLHARIEALVAEEHALREGGSGLDEGGRARMSAVEARLDQTYDLLRQREARRRAGQDPAAAGERPQAEVEGYTG